jgi:cathepsin A (carboxypeptidase C)
MINTDQPVPVGFSYAGGNLTDDLLPGRAEKSAIDFLTAVLLIYEVFSGVYFAALTPLHLSGESYAGRYLPVYADAIVDYNSRVAPSDRIPLRSVMVGNGYTSPKHLFPSFYETACFEVHGIPAILNETQCAHIEAAVDRCELLLEACVSSGDEIICHAGGEFCQEAIMDPITQSGSNAYDRTMKCPEDRCYPHFKNVIDWFNSAEVQEALEIVDQTGRAANVSLQKESVTDRFKASGDIWMSSMPYMERVLQSDQVDVLYYTGINDVVCNSIGVLRTIMDLKWRGHAKFVATPMVPVSWTLQDGSNGGRMKQNGRLTAAELYGGGHVVCKPVSRTSDLLTTRSLVSHGSARRQFKDGSGVVE